MFLCCPRSLEGKIYFRVEHVDREFGNGRFKSQLDSIAVSLSTWIGRQQCILSQPKISMVTWGRDSPTTGGRGRSRSVARTVRAVFSLLVNLQHHFVFPHPRPSDNYYLSAGTVGKVHPVLVNLERLGFRWREGKARAFLKQCNLPPMW